MRRKIASLLLIILFLGGPAGPAFSLSTGTFKLAMRMELPALGITEKQSFQVPSARQVFGNLLYRVLGVNFAQPGTLLDASIPAMSDISAKGGSAEGQSPSKVAYVDGENIPPSSADSQEQPISEIPQVNMGELAPLKLKDVLVAVYHTHTGETYKRTDGVDRLTGKRGAVVKVGAELARLLKEKYGINTAVDATVHDAVYNKSYAKAQVTAKALVKKYPKMIILVDLHRDQVPREKTVVKLKGAEVARVLLVVGSDAKESHPAWKKNYQLAQEIHNMMNSLYPGLSRGITVKKYRFNQQFHPGALIIEVGGENNSTEESMRTARLLSDVLARVVSKRVK